MPPVEVVCITERFEKLKKILKKLRPGRWKGARKGLKGKGLQAEKTAQIKAQDEKDLGNWAG